MNNAKKNIEKTIISSARDWWMWNLLIDSGICPGASYPIKELKSLEQAEFVGIIPCP